MADEIIVLDIDETEAVRGAQRANRAIEAVEKSGERASASATRAATAEGDRVVRIVERSRQSVERLVAQAERRASFAGSSRIERLEAERQLFVSRVSGDERAIARVNAAFAKLREAEASASGGARLTKIFDSLRDPLNAASTAAEGFLTRAGRIGLIAGGAAVGVGLLAKAGFDLVSSAGQQAEQVTNLADRLGVTARQAYILKIQAESTGVGIDALESSYRNLATAIEDGSEEGKRGAESLARLGVRTLELDGRVRNARDLYADIGAALGQIPSPAERARRAVEALGRGGLTLIPLVNSFKDTEAAAGRAANGINDPFLAELNRADAKIDELTAKWNAFKLILAGRVIASVEFVSDSLAPFDQAAASALNAARGRNTNLTLRPGDLAPRNPGVLGAQLDADAGQTIIESFRRRRDATDEGLRDLLGKTTRDRAAAEAKLLPGLGVAEASKRIAAIDALTKKERGLKSAIEGRAEAQRKAEERRKGLADFADSIDRETFKTRDDLTKDFGRVFDERLRLQTEALAKELDNEIEFATETRRIRQELSLGQFGLGIAEVESGRDRSLARLEALGAQTLAQQVGLEQRKAAISEDAALKLARLRADLLDEEARQEVAQAEFIAGVRGLSEEQLGERRTAILERYRDRGRELEIRSLGEIEQIQIESAGRVADLQIAEQRRVYEDSRRSFESLLDQLFAQSRSWGDRLRSVLTAAFLTPLKRGASDIFARSVAGGGGGDGAGGGGGLFGGLFSRVLGGSGGFGIGSAGAPGGTVGFNGPVGASASGGRLAGSLGSSFAAQGKGALGFLGSLGNIGFGPRGGDFGGEVSGSFRGVGGLKGGALLAGGGILAFDGLRRGGALGLAETTAGGALIGFKFGGPLGAAIGAGAGAAAGLIRLFVKGAEEKIVQRARSIYGITLDRRYARDPILGIIKNQFGGNIDVGLRSAQVRDLIELYGMANGQGTGPLSDRIRPLSFSDRGSSGFFENAAYFNGRPLTLAASSAAAATPAPVIIQSVQLVVGQDQDSVAGFMRGEIAPVVASSPTAVATALSSANRLSIGRRDALANQFGMVTA